MYSKKIILGISLHYQKVSRLFYVNGCFAIKSNSSENGHRFEARLVTKGFSQREGIDYSECFVPVVRYESIRMLLALTSKEVYEIAKFDVKKAFINGDLQEDI